MNLPLISIVMPVKNATPYLKDCLDSILNQTYENWELVAINDHSTDDSFAILNEYAQKDARIKSIHNKKHGIIEALRLAYKFSSGELITRMDADDIMAPNKLAVLSEGLFKYGKGFLGIGQVKYFSETTLGDGYKKYAQWLNQLAESGNNFSEIYKECVIPSPAWMVYKSDFELCGGFDSDWYPEDYDLCFRFYGNGLKCIPTQEVTHLWRDYGNRTSRTHPNYADNQFVKIKTHYFKQLNYNPKRPLILWGAGKRGKAIAKSLINLDLNFTWACNNDNKIGHHIYNQILVSTSEIDFKAKPQIIVSVANSEEQKAILSIFKNYGLAIMQDYFFFC